MPKNQRLFDEIEACLKERIMFLDGAMGSMIQQYQLGEEDFVPPGLEKHSKSLKGNNDLLCLSKPDVVREIHKVKSVATNLTMNYTRAGVPRSRCRFH